MKGKVVGFIVKPAKDGGKWQGNATIFVQYDLPKTDADKKIVSGGIAVRPLMCDTAILPCKVADMVGKTYGISQNGKNGEFASEFFSLSQVVVKMFKISFLISPCNVDAIKYLLKDGCQSFRIIEIPDMTFVEVVIYDIRPEYFQKLYDWVKYKGRKGDLL